MSEVDALFRLLQAAPPRSAEIVKRVTLRGLTLDAVAAQFSLTPELGKRLVLRALLDVESGGTLRVPDADEPALAEAVLSDTVTPTDPLATRLHGLRTRLRDHAPALEKKLEAAAEAFEKSPDRARDEWLRRLAIVVVLALSAYFYWREQNKPKVVLLPRTVPDAGVQH
jgi:hypothetical protein